MTLNIHPNNEEVFFNLNHEQRRAYAIEQMASGKYGLEEARELISNTPTGEIPTAIKHDVGKTDWAILPLDALEEIIKVFQFGEKKYARGNYANGEGLEYTRILNSLMRHTTSFMRGEDNDPETGLSHMAHAGCCTLMLLHYITHQEQFSTNDNRAKTILK